jgi:HSP20 family molecular chaperone IbpA
VDPERASASYDDGILRIEIPLAQAEESPRRIRIEEGE